MRYPVIVDQNGDTSRTYGITGLPTLILIDKQGVVRDAFVGFDPTGEARLRSCRSQAPRRAGPSVLRPPPGRPRGGGTGDPHAERAASCWSIARAKRLLVERHARCP